MQDIEVTAIVSDQGTVVVMEGDAENGEHVVFAVDHRPAREIVAALARGEQVTASIEAWQVI